MNIRGKKNSHQEIKNKCKKPRNCINLLGRNINTVTDVSPPCLSVCHRGSASQPLPTLPGKAGGFLFATLRDVPWGIRLIIWEDLVHKNLLKESNVLKTFNSKCIYFWFRIASLVFIFFSINHS